MIRLNLAKFWLFLEKSKFEIFKKKISCKDYIIKKVVNYCVSDLYLISDIDLQENELFEER